MMPFSKSIDNGKKFFIMNLVVNLNMKKLMSMETDRMKKIIIFKLWKHSS